MDKFVLKDDVLTNIITALDSADTFYDTMKYVIKEAERFLFTSNAGIYQISSDGSSLNLAVDYSSEKARKLEKGPFRADGFFLADDQGALVTTYSDLTESQKKIMDKLGFKTCVFVPIHINSVCAMYFAIIESRNEIKFSEEQIQFIKDVTMIVQSIAQRKVTNNSLISSYEVLREILSRIGSGIMVFDRNNGNVLFENDIAKSSQEYRRVLKSVTENKMPDLDNLQFNLKPVEHYDARSGLWFSIKFSGLTWIDGSDAIVCNASDITLQKKNQQKIEYQANNDFLTGIYNRMKSETDLVKLLARSAQTGEKGAVLFLDLDDFKHINDGLGHQFGDILLQKIASNLQNIPMIRKHCYRMGGDEFLVIVDHDSYDGIDRIIKAIVSLFNKPWDIMGTEYLCTMSMGVAIFPDNSLDVNEIVKMADMAMYEAKISGKNRYAYYDSKKGINTSRRYDIENNMRQAIATEIEEFLVYYQPVINTENNECVSCEALVRWDSKALGFIGPGEFIPLAEYLGLITDIGDYVFEKACLQCKKWNDMGFPDFKININLSVVQLLQMNIVENIKNMTKRTGVNPKNLTLEVTESFAINDMDRVLKIIKEFKESGFNIALDDFGTGYSSLNYIKKLPLDVIKVDKTFIDDILTDEYAQSFVKLIVELSKTIGTKVVVEGIENEEQCKMIKNLGVNFIQGFYYGRPVSSIEFERNYLGKKLEGSNYVIEDEKKERLCI